MGDDVKLLFKAMIWISDTNEPGKRVNVFAENLVEAKKLLENEYGEGNVFNLHSEVDDDKIR